MNTEIGARLLLADELGKPLRAQRSFDVFVALLGVHQARVAAHVIPRRYLFGSNSPMVVTVGPLLPSGTITRALAS